MEDWVIPELLSTDALKKILQKKNVSLNVASQDKASLLQLYDQHVQPKPQRTYRNNRQGTALAQTQQQLVDSRKRSHDTMTVHSKSLGATSNGAKHPAIRTTGVVRLKPPPAAASLDKKVIILSNSGAKGANNKSPVNTNVTYGKPVSSVAAVSKEKLSGEAVSSNDSCIKVTQPGKVKLSRPSTVSESEAAPAAAAATGSSNASQQHADSHAAVTVSMAESFTRSAQDKSKIQKISWP